MRDSYEEMLIKLKITQDDFISWGINEIKTLLPDITTVEENWNRLKRCIDSGNEVYIRGYGRDKKNGQINRICNLYKEAGFNTSVRLDPTNNLKPQQLMKQMGKYTVGKKDTNNHIAIQNYKLSHLWGYTKNIYLFENPWNVIYTPIVIDPLTGHETYDNNLKLRFKEDIAKLVFGKYGKFIEEYNNILENDDRVKKIIEICENNKEDKFYMEMKKQWVKLTSDNVLKG